MSPPSSTAGTPGHWTSAGLTLSYLARGNPASPLVVIHHGFLDHSGSWDRVAERLGRYRVVAVDARGHGDSEWIGRGGAYWISDYVLDLRNLLLHLGDPPVALVGHSMGASVVSYYAGAFRDRVRAVVMVDGLGPPHEPPPTAAGVLRRFVETTRHRQADRSPRPMAGVSEAAERMRALDPLLSEERALEQARSATRPVDAGVVWKFDPLHRARMGVPFNRDYAMAIWSAIEAPVLHVRGGRSPFRLPDHAERAAAFADFRDVTVPDAGHNVHVHAPDALAEHVERFLAEVPAR